MGPDWAPVGQSWAPNGPRMGLTGAHLGMLLGCQLAEKKTGKFDQGKYTVVQNLVALQHVCGVYRGHYGDGYLLVMSHIWCS